MTAPDSSAGLVVLVGAGPGPAGLLTRAGARWLARAEVVVYDRLVDRSVLRLAPGSAERIDVGKAPGGVGPDQQRINELLIERARAGRCVVRLKGGDPLVFSRGGEEAEALARAGVPYRIVPGVTAALAAAAAAGIPLTDRRFASSVAFVAGHRPAGGEPRPIDWAALAGIETVVFYMGLGKLGEISTRLIEAGRDPQTPSAVVTLPARGGPGTVVAPLEHLARAARRAGLRPPAVIIVGRVVSLRGRLAWMEKLPLFGQTVIVTRPARQAGELAERLEELGAAVIVAPAIEVRPPADFAAVDSALRRLGQFDLVVFTSPNGVAAFISRCRQLGLDGRALAGAKVAAIGPATADVLRGQFIRPDIVPGTFTTEALVAAIRSSCDLAGRRVLLVRPEAVGESLRAALSSAGAAVEEVAFYRVARPPRLDEKAAAALARRRVDWVTFTSSSAVENFSQLLAEAAVRHGVEPDLRGVRLAAIGPVTAGTMRSLGLEPAVVAGEHSVEGLVRAMAGC